MVSWSCIKWVVLNLRFQYSFLILADSKNYKITMRLISLGIMYTRYFPQHKKSTMKWLYLRSVAVHCRIRWFSSEDESALSCDWHLVRSLQVIVRLRASRNIVSLSDFVTGWRKGKFTREHTSKTTGFPLGLVYTYPASRTSVLFPSVELM